MLEERRWLKLRMEGCEVGGHYDLDDCHAAQPIQIAQAP